MRRNVVFAIALLGILTAATPGFAGNTFVGPDYYPWITGNDTGGIISYAPALEGIYPQIARDYCARWRRLAHVTSVHRVYGDYISFSCIDKPWVIH